MLIISLVLFQIIIFIVLIFIFRKIMTTNVTSATMHLEKLNQDYAKKEEDLRRQIEEINQKSQEILAKAQEEAEKTKAQIIKAAEDERDRILKQGRLRSDEIIQQADKSRQLLLEEINQRIYKEAIDKACELVQNTLPEQFKQNVHLHWVEELIEDGFSQLERLRIPRDIQEIKVISAFSLSEGQRKNLFKKLKGMLGYEVTLKEEIDPKVVAGLIITIGSLVLDGSLKNKIQEKARNV